MRLVRRLASGCRVRLFFGTRKAAVLLVFFFNGCHCHGRFLTISALAKNAIVWEYLLAWFVHTEFGEVFEF